MRLPIAFATLAALCACSSPFKTTSVGAIPSLAERAAGTGDTGSDVLIVVGLLGSGIAVFVMAAVIVGRKIAKSRAAKKATPTP